MLSTDDGMLSTDEVRDYSASPQTKCIRQPKCRGPSYTAVYLRRSRADARRGALGQAALRCRVRVWVSCFRSTRVLLCDLVTIAGSAGDPWLFTRRANAVPRLRGHAGGSVSRGQDEGPERVAPASQLGDGCLDHAEYSAPLAETSAAQPAEPHRDNAIWFEGRVNRSRFTNELRRYGY
jgi:hypothetical protein